MPNVVVWIAVTLIVIFNAGLIIGLCLILLRTRDLHT